MPFQCLTRPFLRIGARRIGFEKLGVVIETRNRGWYLVRSGVSARSSWVCISIVGAICSETTLTLLEAELGRLRDAKDVITRVVMTIIAIVWRLVDFMVRSPWSLKDGD
jgi:hypothetical protein